MQYAQNKEDAHLKWMKEHHPEDFEDEEEEDEEEADEEDEDDE